MNNWTLNINRLAAFGQDEWLINQSKMNKKLEASDLWLKSPVTLLL